jgi:hypothetical protein
VKGLAFGSRLASSAAHRYARLRKWPEEPEHYPTVVSADSEDPGAASQPNRLARNADPFGGRDPSICISLATVPAYRASIGQTVRSPLSLTLSRAVFIFEGTTVDSSSTRSRRPSLARSCRFQPSLIKCAPSTAWPR